MSRYLCNRSGILRGLAGAAMLGLVLAGHPAWAQESGADTTKDNGDGRVKLTIDVGDDSDQSDNSPLQIRIDGDSQAADYVRFGDSIHVGKDEHIRGDVVVIGGAILVQGKVSGDCIAVGGSIEIADGAEVTGEVVCVGGTLTLGDDAEIGMDAVSVWGTLNASPTAKVGGDLTRVEGPIIGISPDWFRFAGFHYNLWEFFTRVIWVFILAGIGILAFHIFPSRMARLSDNIDRRGLVSFLAGLAGWILWLPVFVLLLVTVVGIPVAILLIFLTPIMTVLGYLAVARVVGGKTGRQGVAGGIFFGVLALEGALLLGHLFGAFGSGFGILGTILTVIGCSVIFVAGTMGFGAFLITRFRAMERPPAAPETSAPMSPPSMS